jgi:IclR family KDG regulon transcriptional repressor
VLGVFGVAQQRRDQVSYTISAVDRALLLLEALADMPDSGVSELSAKTGYTKTMIFRLLHTLEERGFVAKDPVRRTYALSWRAMLLGDQARRQSRLISAADPHMDELHKQTGCNVSVQIRDGLHSVVVALRRAGQDQRIYAEVGRRGPLHAGGGPKVLLAFAPEEVRETVLSSELARYTPNTMIAPDRLRAALDMIRRDGWVISEGELDHSTCSVAIPIYDSNSEVAAALAVTGKTDLLQVQQRGHVLDLLREAGAKITRLVGAHGAGVPKH